MNEPISRIVPRQSAAASGLEGGGGEPVAMPENRPRCEASAFTVRGASASRQIEG
jgi:hypothetical protein